MSKQTSVEWLLKELYTKMNLSGNGRVLDEILEEAKEMHKQEIIDAYDQDLYGGLYGKSKYNHGKEYYQQTYQSVDTNEMIDHIGDVNEMVDVTKQNDVREDDVEKLAEEYAFKTYHELEDAKWFTPLNLGFRAGYNKAKENTYTEEQVREAIEMARETKDPYFTEGYKRITKYTNSEIIQSLKQSK